MAALAEIGDPAQLRCPTLAARFEIRILLVAGATAGMLIADIPAVLFAHRFADRLTVRGMPVRAGGAVPRAWQARAG